MNPDSLNLETATSLPQSDITSMNLSPTHLLWTSAVILIVSHFGAQYLASVSPRGYWFWFTILNLAV